MVREFGAELPDASYDEVHYVVGGWPAGGAASAIYALLRSRPSGWGLQRFREGPLTAAAAFAAAGWEWLPATGFGQ